MKQTELIFNKEDSKITGIDAISLVGKSADHTEFVVVDKDKRFIVGPVIVPGVTKGNPLWGSKGNIAPSTITKLMDDYIQKGNQDKTTIHHSDKIDQCYTIRNWQVDRSNGVMAGFGFDDGDKRVEDGAWMTGMHVGNDDVWNKDVMTGEVNGFSMQGSLRAKEAEVSNVDYHIMEANKLIKELIQI